MPVYPRYAYYPRWQAAPEWVAPLVAAFAAHADELDTATVKNTSDAALAILCPDLQASGFQVEAGKLHGDKLFRPVFFGENGAPERQY